MRPWQQVARPLLALAFILTLAACAGGAVTERTSPSVTGSNPAATPASTAPSDRAATGGALALAYDPADGSLLEAKGAGLFRWREGSHWAAIAMPKPDDLSGVVVNPDAPATLYVSGMGLGVLRSDEGGQSWRATNTGLPKLDVSALAVHSFRRDTLYAWLQGDGIYRTEDGGAHWQRMPDQGPPDKDVRALIHSTLPGSMNTGWLYAVTPSGSYLSMDCF